MTTIPVRPVLRAMPVSPRLSQQKREVRDLLDALRRRDPTGLARYTATHDGAQLAADPELADGQRVIAREYGFTNWERLEACVELNVTPGPTVPYATDPDWYEGRAAGLVEMHRGALPNALAQIRAWHPDLAHLGDREIAAAPFTPGDARLVYARQHGMENWEALLARVASLASAHEPFADAFAAIERGDAAALSRIIAEHPDVVTLRGSNGNTLLNLVVAIERADGPLLNIVLAAGIDPGVANDRGWTPLHQAATISVALVERLLLAGSVVTTSAHGDGGTPLAVALWAGRTDIARRLAREAMLPDNLRIHAALNDANAVAAFFDANGSLFARAATGRGFYRPHSGFPAWTPSTSRQEVVDEALSWAARNGAIDAMEILLARGARVDGVAYRASPLMAAVYSRQVDTVRWLLEHGAKPNLFIPFHGGETGNVTALHLAAQTDDPALVQQLLDHGADRSIKDENYHADAAGWAEHVGALRVTEMLRARS